MKNDKQFQQLTELLRRASELLYPFTEQDDIAHFQRKQVRDRLYGEFPKCFLAFKGIGSRSTPLFPVCNRAAMMDPKMIAFSKRLATKMQESGKFDNEQLTEIIGNLDRLYSKYTKEPIKPSVEAAKKGLQTKLFKNIKKYIKDNTK